MVKSKIEFEDIGHRVRVIVDTAIAAVLNHRSGDLKANKKTDVRKSFTKGEDKPIRQLLTLGSTSNVRVSSAERSEFLVTDESNETAALIRNAVKEGSSILLLNAVRDTYNGGVLTNGEAAASLLAYVVRAIGGDTRAQHRELTKKLKSQHTGATRRPIQAELDKLVLSCKSQMAAYTMAKMYLDDTDDWFAFLHYCKVYAKSTGWGSRHCKNVGTWYTWVGRSNARLLFSTSTYGTLATRGNHGFRHSDVFKLSHVHGHDDAQRRAVLQHLRIGGQKGQNEHRQQHNTNRKRKRLSEIEPTDKLDHCHIKKSMGADELNKPFVCSDRAGTGWDVVSLLREEAKSARADRRPNKKDVTTADRIMAVETAGDGTAAITQLDVVQLAESAESSVVSAITASWTDTLEAGLDNRHVHPEDLKNPAVWRALIQHMHVQRVVDNFTVYDVITNMWTIGNAIDILKARLSDKASLAVITPLSALGLLEYYEGKRPADKHKAVLDIVTSCADSSAMAYSLTSPILVDLPLGKTRKRPAINGMHKGRVAVCINGDGSRFALRRHVHLAVTIVNQWANVDKKLMSKLNAVDLLVAHGGQFITAHSIVVADGEQPKSVSPTTILTSMNEKGDATKSTGLMKAIKTLPKQKVVFDAIIAIDTEFTCADKLELSPTLEAMPQTDKHKACGVLITLGKPSPPCDHLHVARPDFIDLQGDVDEFTVRLAVDFARGVLLTSRVPMQVMKTRKQKKGRRHGRRKTGNNNVNVDDMDVGEMIDILEENGVDFGDEDFDMGEDE